MQHGREDTRRIGSQIIGLAPLLHVGRTSEKLVERHPAHSCGKEADGREHGEAASDVRRDRKHRYALRVPDLAKHTVGRIRREQEVPAGLVLVHRTLDPGTSDQILGHRLCSRSGLADDIEQGPAGLQTIEEHPEGVRIGVVHDVQAREVIALLIAHGVPERSE